MCNEKNGCEKPDRLDGRPQDCSPEQVTECHGQTEGHPCVQKDCTPEQIKECHEEARDPS